MRYGDIQGKGKVYSDSGDLLLKRGEKILGSQSGILRRGYIGYKLGWRTIMFKGYGSFHFTNIRVVYLEVPQYIDKIHTMNLDHEVGDFGGWDYHAHKMRRAAAAGAMLFFEVVYSEIIKFKHAKEYSTIFVKDSKHKYKILVVRKIGEEIENYWNNLASNFKANI
jgi:hypothetical protein